MKLGSDLQKPGLEHRATELAWPSRCTPGLAWPGLVHDMHNISRMENISSSNTRFKKPPGIEKERKKKTEEERELPEDRVGVTQKVLQFALHPPIFLASAAYRALFRSPAVRARGLVTQKSIKCRRSASTAIVGWRRPGSLRSRLGNHLAWSAMYDGYFRFPLSIPPSLRHVHCATVQMARHSRSPGALSRRSVWIVS